MPYKPYFTNPHFWASVLTKDGKHIDLRVKLNEDVVVP